MQIKFKLIFATIGLISGYHAQLGVLEGSAGDMTAKQVSTFAMHYHNDLDRCDNVKVIIPLMT